jgi:NDP-sugar pyrophosphorylase family protein
MAAGKGTRLAPLTDVLPKPAVPVANEPVMGRMLRLLARQGFRQITCNISYKADIMRAVFGDGTAWGVDIVWSEESEPLGTAGGLRNAERHVRNGDEPILILSGDGLHDANLAALVAAHRERGARVTMGLTRVLDASQYGVAVQSDDGWITGFQEKPAPGTEVSRLANTGIYVLDPSVLDDMPPAGEFYDFGSDLFPRMVAAGDRVLGVELPGFWDDVGSLEELLAGTFAVLDGRVSDLPNGEVADGGILIHPDAKVDSTVMLHAPCVIGPGATVGAGAALSSAVVLPGAIIEPGTMVAAGIVGAPEGLKAWAESFNALSARV